MADADARVRLEGRAQLLEATRLQYRTLLQHLTSVRWKQRLRTSVNELRELARVQPEVDEAIERATRHAAKEHWPASSPLLKCLHDVVAARAQLEKLTAKRLGEQGESLDLAARFQVLEHHAFTAPRLILPGQRWANAQALLPWPSSELTVVAHFGERLESVFGKPLTVKAGPLLVSSEELDAVQTAWKRGVEAIDAVWQRLEAVDLTGALGRYLRSRARRAPNPSRNTGPDVLLHAEYWRAMTSTRIDAAMPYRIGPVVLKEGERFATLRWLLLRERDDVTAVLEVQPASRAALIELAYLMNRLPRDGRQWGTLWPRLLELAERADGDREDPHHRWVFNALSMLGSYLQLPARKFGRLEVPYALLRLVKDLKAHVENPRLT